MNVTTINNDGTTTTYTYDPQHYDRARLFYAQAVVDGLIKEFAITDREHFTASGWNVHVKRAVTA